MWRDGDTAKAINWVNVLQRNEKLGILKQKSIHLEFRSDTDNNGNKKVKHRNKKDLGGNTKLIQQSKSFKTEISKVNSNLKVSKKLKN